MSGKLFGALAAGFTKLIKAAKAAKEATAKSDAVAKSNAKAMLAKKESLKRATIKSFQDDFKNSLTENHKEVDKAIKEVKELKDAQKKYMASPDKMTTNPLRKAVHSKRAVAVTTITSLLEKIEKEMKQKSIAAGRKHKLINIDRLAVNNIISNLTKIGTISSASFESVMHSSPAPSTSSRSITKTSVHNDVKIWLTTGATASSLGSKEVRINHTIADLLNPAGYVSAGLRREGLFSGSSSRGSSYDGMGSGVSRPCGTSSGGTTNATWGSGGVQ